VIRDVNGDHTIDFDDRIIAGNSLPKFILSLNNAFMYKRWDFNLFFYGIFGHDLVNTYRALYEAPMMVTSYNLPETAFEQRNSESQDFQNSNFYSDHHIENASFLSLDNLCIGYTFTRAESKTIKRLRAFIAGNNLFYITNYKGIDPNPRYGDSGYNYNEVYDQLIPGIDRTNTWYRSRSVTLGVNVLF
jgi:iron complex outermembrane receptor protein